MTMNKVVIQVSTDGSAVVLDWNKQMDKAVVALTPYGVGPMLPDNVHPNLLGNILLAATLVKYVGTTPTNYSSIKQELERLPADYITPLGWAAPLEPKYFDPVIKALLQIADTP